MHPARVITISPAGSVAAVLAIVAVAPFERPLFGLPGGFTLTTVEAVLMLAIAVITGNLARRRMLLGAPIPLLAPGLAFLAALTLAAVTAPADQGNALRFVLRMAMAAILFVLIQRTIQTRLFARRLVAALLAVGSIVAAIALLETAQVAPVVSALTAFRPGFHVVGGQLRATSTLLYPTIASMYLEMAFALGLWLLIDTPRHNPSRRVAGVVVFAALVLIAAGISATFTRAGLIGMAAAIVLMAALQLSRVPRTRAGLGRLTALSAAVVGCVLLSHTPELLATRLTTEGSQAWYGASYHTPATLELSTGEHRRVPIELVNTGRLAWDSSRQPPFALAYHWLRAGSDEVIQFDGARTAFPRVVAPGERVAMDADVFAPGQPGSYTLVWDVVHESRSWLSTEGVAAARTAATVTGAVVTAVSTRMDRLPAPTVRPLRPALWSAAIRIAADRPWNGVGPDNYRNVYGPYLGIERWDRRVHANNMYLEVLAGAGVPGLVTLVWLFAAAGWSLWQRARQAAPASHVAAAAALATWAMVAGHGLVDSFLAFTTTYVSFAVVAGLAFSPGLIAAETDAHRL